MNGIIGACLFLIALLLWCKEKITDIVFLFVHLLTIIPRFLAFFYCRKYIAKLKRIREIKLEKEHENRTRSDVCK